MDLLVRCDGAGASHDLPDWLTVQGRARGRRLEYIVGFAVTEKIREEIDLVPKSVWTPATDAGGGIREGRDVAELAEVAEVPFTASTSRREAEHVTSRLVVRRGRRLQPLAGDGTEQGQLFAASRHHGFITNSSLDLLEADQTHRDHAVVEEVIAELKNGPLTHLRRGSTRPTPPGSPTP